MTSHSLFPEPTTADQIASVDHLRKDAAAKMQAASRAMDRRAVAYWLAEAERLDRVRSSVVNASQIDMLQPQERTLL